MNLENKEQTAEPVIKVDQLNFSIDLSDILKEVSIAIEKNEFVGLLGPNGCGKSTLLKHIYGHYQTKNQAIYLNGEAIATMKTKEIARKMAVVIQENSTEFDFTVMEMLQMARYSHKNMLEKDTSCDEEICKQALEKVGLLTFGERQFQSLSGGEKQRIYLAMAFAQESPLIVLDEPTNYLDIGYQLLIMDTLEKFSNRTIFTSIHDMNLAAQYCDRLIVMKEGRVLTTGTPDEVLTKELILNVFGVDCEIQKRIIDGRIQINFLGYHVK